MILKDFQQVHNILEISHLDPSWAEIFVLPNKLWVTKERGPLKGQLQGHTAMLAARQERGERGK